MIIDIAVDAEVVTIVRPVSAVVAPVRVIGRESRMDGPLMSAAEQRRVSPDRADVTAAVRTMYKRVGLDPTRNRPSSEALLRRVRKGDALPRVNSLVDVINWCSLESQLPFGLYDTAAVDGAVTLRLGRDNEAYQGIGKDDVHVAGRLVLVDAAGAFGNPTSDSRRTMVTEATRSALVVIFAPAELSQRVAEAALALTATRIAEYCSD
ncbi:MAG: hypothetical protein HQ485_09560 [Acidobacteria bacterium]|nr:hypothetical protein [Acidobacteriota bacterium]